MRSYATNVLKRKGAGLGLFLRINSYIKNQLCQISRSDPNSLKQFALTPDKAQEVEAPLIRECHANFECRLHDDSLIDKYNFFIFEVVKAHVAASPKHPETLHYTGDGVFMISGKIISRKSLFRPDML
jgi:flavin reductase (DIM6/NTAB) family NADH-FMN oxidoreductase RutF